MNNKYMIFIILIFAISMDVFSDSNDFKKLFQKKWKQSKTDNSVPFGFGGLAPSFFM